MLVTLNVSYLVLIVDANPPNLALRRNFTSFMLAIDAITMGHEYKRAVVHNPFGKGPNSVLRDT